MIPTQSPLEIDAYLFFSPSVFDFLGKFGVVVTHRQRFHVAGRTPEPANVLEAIGNVFLLHLLGIFHNVVALSHVPLDEIPGPEMDKQVVLATLDDAIPFFGEKTTEFVRRGPG